MECSLALNKKKSVMKEKIKKVSIYILDDDRYYGLYLAKALRNEKYDIEYFQHEKECIQNLDSIPDILILDHRLEYATGLEILEEVNRKCKGKTMVIYLSAQENVHVAVKAMKEGAITYVEKSSFSVEAIIDTIEQIASLTNNFNNNLDITKFRSQSR